MVPCSSADNWKPPIHVSNWLIFCCVNFMLHQKKEMKMIKNKKMPKKYIKGLSNIELTPLTRDVMCSKL